jgi:D-arabinose 5-phosphate isomerase GutQ
MVHEGSGHFQRLIKELLPQAQRILVVGCGRSGKEVVDLAQALPVICWRPVRAVLAPAIYCWARK